MRPVKRVVLVGQDIALWLSASVVAAAFADQDLSITVIEQPSLLRSHDVVASLPPLEGLHARLGLKEDTVLKTCAGQYSLGTLVRDFVQPDSGYFQPYGDHGPDLGGMPFFAQYIRARQAGLTVAYEDFSLTASAAKQGRFLQPSREALAYGLCDHGYHLGSREYAALLKAEAVRRRVSVQPGRAAEAVRDAETGLVSAVRLRDGSVVEGDLFLDCSGPSSVLQDQDVTSWRQWFPFDRMISVGAEGMRRLPPFAQMRALPNSILHTLPVQERTGITHVFHSHAKTDDEALRQTAAAGLPLAADAVADPLDPGCRKRNWSGNVVALGDTACVFDPSDHPRLFALQFALVLLVSLFPRQAGEGAGAREFNRRTQAANERLRDFQIAQLKLNGLSDGVWAAVRDRAVPDTLSEKIDLFSANGQVPSLNEETFSAESWRARFFGNGLLPDGFAPGAVATGDEALITEMRHRLHFIRTQVEAMDSHDAYVELHCARSFA